MKCEYGCNQKAIQQLKNKKWCCSSSHNSCPAKRHANSVGLKKKYQEEITTRGYIKPRKPKECKSWITGKTILNSNILSKKYKIRPEEVFILNSKVSKTTIKRYLTLEPNFIYECQRCKIKDWRGKPITLELDHINGNNKDQRKENLRFLCPNCHSLTPTYKKKK